MLTNFLKGNVLFTNRADSWEEAIRLSAMPLLRSGCIEPRYIEAMIESVNINGSYVVILPEVAMPHARHEQGAIKTGLTFLQLKEPVLFPGGKPVKLLMALSAEDNESHLDMLGQLGMALVDDEVVQRLKDASTESEVIKIMNATR